ncbi:potassium voltage-gated channel Shal-related subfamily D member 1 [Fistulifera solaris]|uniref:Potassium voltage-gated channel Shal-related subfamily D member 1 n=1 Tax=Fistulifera solaris TaxID=1519565 RepID=A0A1Z5KHN3_FISSO|nr:potassium voltage-gated channel Shal-related subfamily D member 1 [Fistulifera solaris]|eukprot:GAX25727.1 potassium voltage-gated channel Shal-related subfamily D member 1 [Fistulifera solaris]
MICLNVGGIRYQVSRETLTRYEGSLLATYANSWNENTFNQEIFIFRDGHLFAYVLDYLQSGKVHWPSSVIQMKLKQELDYYGIPVDASKIVEEKDYFIIDRLTKEIKEHKAAIEEKERQVVAIVESYRLTHQYAEIVSKSSGNGFSTHSFPVTGNFDKKLLQESLLSRGLDAYFYQNAKQGAKVILGPITEEDKRIYGEKRTGFQFTFHDNTTTPLASAAIRRRIVRSKKR